MLQPEPQGCLPPTHSSHAWPGWDPPPRPQGVLAWLFPAVSLGQSKRSRPGGRHCAPRRSCRCQSSWCAARDNAPGGGQCACPAASTGPQLCQGPGPIVGPWSQDAGTCQIRCRGGGSPNPKRSGTPGFRRPGPPTGQQEMGYHPTATFPVGLSGWQPLPLPFVPGWPWRAGPSVLFWPDLGALRGQQKPLVPRLAAVGMTCSEARSPGDGQCVAEDIRKGQSLVVSRSRNVAGRSQCLPRGSIQ